MANLKIPHRWLDKQISIALVGCGGTGGEMLDELFRIDSLLKALGGQGLHVTAYDPDRVTGANIGRQRFWPCDIGFNKAEVLITRVNSFGNTDWEYEKVAFDIQEHASSFNMLITCVDKPEVRAEIGRKSKEHLDSEKDFYRGASDEPQFWLDCGNDAFRGNVILGHFYLGDAPQKIPNVYDLYPVLDTMKGNDEPSCSTVAALEKQDYGINRSVAREAANLVWQFLRHGELGHHGSYIDIKAGTVTPLAIDENVWKTFLLAS